MAKKKAKGKRKSGFVSKAQVRWAFATKQPFAHRWAKKAKAVKGKKVWYQTLPKKKNRTKKKLG